MPQEYFPDRPRPEPDCEPSRSELGAEQLNRLTSVNHRLVGLLDDLRMLGDTLHGTPGVAAAAAVAPTDPVKLDGRMALMTVELDRAFELIGRLETQSSRLRYGNF